MQGTASSAGATQPSRLPQYEATHATSAEEEGHLRFSSSESVNALLQGAEGRAGAAQPSGLGQYEVSRGSMKGDGGPLRPTAPNPFEGFTATPFQSSTDTGEGYNMVLLDVGHAMHDLHAMGSFSCCCLIVRAVHDLHVGPSFCCFHWRLHGSNGSCVQPVHAVLSFSCCPLYAAS